MCRRPPFFNSTQVQLKNNNICRDKIKIKTIIEWPDKWQQQIVGNVMHGNDHTKSVRMFSLFQSCGLILLLLLIYSPLLYLRVKMCKMGKYLELCEHEIAISQR